MTDWQDFIKTHVPFDVNGVTGTVKLVFRGDGKVGVFTQSNSPHDDEPECVVRYRDETYSLHLERVRNEDGTFEVSGNGVNDYISREWREDRRDTSVPPSYAKRIEGAIADLLETVWTPEYDRAGLEATVAQALHRLDGQERRLVDELAQVHDEQRALVARLTKEA